MYLQSVYGHIGTSLSLVGAAKSIIFVATNTCLTLAYFSDKHVFVATKHLSRQKWYLRQFPPVIRHCINFIYITVFTASSVMVTSVYLQSVYGHISTSLRSHPHHCTCIYIRNTVTSAQLHPYLRLYNHISVHLRSHKFIYPQTHASYSNTHPTMQFTTKNEIWMQVKYGNIWSVGVKYTSRFTFRSDGFSTVWTSQPHSPASSKRGEEKLCLSAELPRKFCQLPGNPYWLVGSWSTRGRWLQRRSRPRKLVQSVLFSTGQLG